MDELDEELLRVVGEVTVPVLHARTLRLAAPAGSACIPEGVPAFLMSAPLSRAAANPKATLRQFRALYAFLAARALVYLLPSRAGVPDPTRVADLGVVLSHTPEPTLVVSNLRGEARRGEREAGLAFFGQLGLPVETAPPYFAGEADLEPLGGNLYVGAFGRRTSAKALRWLERRFAMRVIPFALEHESLPHLDCSLFALTGEEVLLCTSAAERSALDDIARHVGVIDVSREDAENGITNCVRIDDYVLCASHIEALTRHDADYRPERGKIARLEAICARRNLRPVFFDLSGLAARGATLSGRLMHLNHANF